MKAVILSGNAVEGYHLEPNEEEFDAAGVQYALVEEVPDIILNTPEGHYVVRNDLGEYELATYPEPEPTPPDRIAQLEADNLTLMEAIADLYEMMLGV